MLTLTEAAQKTGLTRSAVFKAIKSGRLSASKDNQGHFLIDPVELFRVYSPVDKVDVSSKQSEIAQETQETVFLRREIELLRKQIEDKREQIADIRNDRDQWRKQATMLLTHQPPQESHKPEAMQPTESLLWRKLFGRH